jgi:hypothetical protein
MLAVVFGAGASYDGFPTFPEDGRRMGDARMPLANELFQNRPAFEAARERFRAFLPLVPYLQNPLSNRSVEQVLEEFELEASQGGQRGHRIRQQLTAIRFYLQTIISHCEKASTDLAQGVTNHLTLIDVIEKNRCEHEPVCLITFNYDCLIERALTDEVSYSFVSQQDYVRRPAYKLFKLHGSTNWGHKITMMPAGTFHGRNDEEINKLIGLSNNIDYSQDFEIVSEIPAFNSGATRLFPALTVPAEKKTQFSCPDSHVNVLKSLLPKVTKLLIIGWRGAEKHFLDMAGPILDQATGVLKIGIVSGTGKSCSETEVNIARVIKVDREWQYFEHGFTNFIISKAANSFIRT